MSDSVTVSRFARVYVDGPESLPVDADSFRDPSGGYYYKLHLSDVSAAEATPLIEKASEVHDVELVRRVEADGFYKERVYVDNPSEVPDDKKVQQGPAGGIYYETGVEQVGVEEGGETRNVAVIHWDDVEHGDEIVYERPDGAEVFAEIVDIDERADTADVIHVDVGGGQVERAMPGTYTVDDAAEKADASVTSDTSGVHSARYSDEDDEEEDIAVAGDVGKSPLVKAFDADVYRVRPDPDDLGDFDEDDVVGVAVDFPNHDVYCDWNNEVFPDELDDPHVSIYGTIDDLEQATGNVTELVETHDVTKADNHHFGPYTNGVSVRLEEGEAYCENESETFRTDEGDDVVTTCPHCGDGLGDPGEVPGPDGETGHLGKADDAWVSFIGPQGGEGWVNLATGEKRYQKKRPGPGPEDADEAEFAAGWGEAPEDVTELDIGQQVEVQYGGEYHQGEVVELNAEGVPVIDDDQTDVPYEATRDDITVTAAETDYDPHDSFFDEESNYTAEQYWGAIEDEVPEDAPEEFDGYEVGQEVAVDLPGEDDPVAIPIHGFVDDTENFPAAEPSLTFHYDDIEEAVGTETMHDRWGEPGESSPVITAPSGAMDDVVLGPADEYTNEIWVEPPEDDMDIDLGDEVLVNGEAFEVKNKPFEDGAYQFDLDGGPTVGLDDIDAVRGHGPESENIAPDADPSDVGEGDEQSWDEEQLGEDEWLAEQGIEPGTAFTYEIGGESFPARPVGATSMTQDGDLSHAVLEVDVPGQDEPHTTPVHPGIVPETIEEGALAGQVETAKDPGFDSDEWSTVDDVEISDVPAGAEVIVEADGYYTTAEVYNSDIGFDPTMGQKEATVYPHEAEIAAINEADEGVLSDGEGEADTTTPSEGEAASAVAEPASDDTVDLDQAEPESFVSAVEEFAEKNENLAPMLTFHDPEELDDHDVFLSDAGDAGVAVSPEGDIQNVFSGEDSTVDGDALMEQAIEAGGETLDCYDGFLTDFYRDHGFDVTGTMDFNPEVAPEGWDENPHLRGQPDVMFMAHQPGDVGEVPTYDGSEWDDAKADSRRAANTGADGGPEGRGVGNGERGSGAGSGGDGRADGVDDSDAAGYDLSSYDPDDVEEFRDMSDIGASHGNSVSAMEVAVMPDGSKAVHKDVSHHTVNADDIKRETAGYEAIKHFDENVPTHTADLDEGWSISEVVPGVDAKDATPEMKEAVETGDFVEMAAKQVMIGNSDLHQNNVRVDEDGNLYAFDLDRAAGDITSDWVGNLSHYDDTLDRTLGELEKSANALGVSTGHGFREAIVERAEEIASGVDGETMDTVYDDVATVSEEYAETIRENIARLANGEISA